ncbi:hypothetical protein [Streptomyces sp. NPDC058279]|uniref:hypothetical protein n=1 Tax=Streptomyces sp. NPDC058279 TaxID=3346418 RepID=UPI0036E44C68
MLRLPRARVMPLSAPPTSYTAAVERYLTGAGIAKSSAGIYRISLTTWGWMLTGEPAPTGPARRGAKPPVFLVAAIDDPALPEVLAELAAARADEMDADTVNRELSIARKAIGWWQRQGWIEGDPTIGIERRPAPPDRTKALAENQIAALWRLDVSLREKTVFIAAATLTVSGLASAAGFSGSASPPHAVALARTRPASRTPLAVFPH